MNEGQLEHYISLLSKDAKQLENFYVKSAFLRDSERLEALMGYLKALAKLPIKAPTNSSFLNSWTPSPLILAGLISGKPQRVNFVSSSKRRNFSSTNLYQDEPAEEAINALDLLNETTNSESPNSPLRKSYIDDDNSSVYSHTSLLDQNLPIGIPCNLKPTYASFLSSTPENRPMEHVPLFNLPSDNNLPEVQVNRRKTTKVRKISRGSGSDESRRGSLTHLAPEIAPLSSSLPNGSGFMSFKEMEKKMSKEKSVPVFSTFSKNFKNSESPINKKILSEDSIDENSDLYTSPTSTSKPMHIFGNRELESQDDTAAFGTSLKDELIAAGYGMDVDFNASPMLQGSSPGSSTGNSLAAKGWSASRKDSTPASSRRESTSKVDPVFPNVESTPVSSRKDSIPRRSSYSKVESTPISRGSSSSRIESTPTYSRKDSTPYSSIRDSTSTLSRRESTSSELSSVENSFNFASEMKNIVKDRKNSITEVGTLTENLSINEVKEDKKIETEEKDKKSEIENNESSGVIVLKKAEELKETFFEEVKDDKNEPVVIEENSLEGTDEYGITRNTLTVLTEIAIEQGLDKQDYRCPSCRKSIGGPFGKFK